MGDAYPPHLSEPLRRSIAVRYVQHELRKLLPSLRDAVAWSTVDADVLRWFDGNPTLAPVRDFWNGVHGISMGFKLKHIVPYVTSLHLTWREEDIDIDALKFGSVLEEIHATRYDPSVSNVRRWFFDPLHHKELAAARTAHEERSAQTVPRDDYPIFVTRKDGVLRVHDGNRRLLRAILFGQPTILAVIGEPCGEPLLFEHWVPTSLLLDLVSLHRYRFAMEDNDATRHIAETIARLIRHSTAGIHELNHRCLHTLREHVGADGALDKAINASLRMLP